MTYEGRLNKTLFYVGLGGCLFLALVPLLGMALNGIPKGSNLTGGLIWILVCLALAALFWFRSRGDSVQARADASGLWVAGVTGAPIPWSDIERVSTMQVHMRGMSPSILRFKLRDPSVVQRSKAASLIAAGDKLVDDSDFGLNVTRLTPGHSALLATIAHYRPDLV
jgi:hypothetical protein